MPNFVALEMSCPNISGNISFSFGALPFVEKSGVRNRSWRWREFGLSYTACNSVELLINCTVV